MDEHLFLKKEGEYAQKQWESWAERYLVITASCVYLPDKITVATLCDELPLQYGLVKKIDYLSDSGHITEGISADTLQHGSQYSGHVNDSVFYF